MLNRSLLALFVLLALVVGVAPAAHAVTGLDDFVCETTTTAGTGTIDLGGALTGGYIGFIAAPNINSGDTIKYRVTTGTGASKKIENGVGVVTDAAPDTLTRDATQTTDDQSAPITELTLAGTSTVCLNWGRDNVIGDKGDITTSNGFDTWTIDADSVALTTDTTGSYAAGDAEAGAALTGDSATSFFSAGTLEDARITGSDEADEVLNSDKGDFTCTTGSCTIDGDAVALTTDTSGNYAAGDAEAGAALTGDSATSFFSTGTLGDAQVDGSAEADEVNPTLGTQTQGNYLDNVTGSATTGVAVTHTPAEGSEPAVAFDFTDKGADPALSADTCVFNGDATSNGEIVCEGDTADTIETRFIITDPTASDKTFTIGNGTTYSLADADKGDITVGTSGTDFQVDADAIGANEISAGAVGTSEAAALDAGDVTTGTFTDAQVSGTNEADEVNPTLGTQTQGNYVDDVTGSATTGIAITHTPAEGSDAAVAFSYTDKGADPALSADTCVFNGDATSNGEIVCEGDTADTIETRIIITDPTASDKTFTIGNGTTYSLADADKGDITVGTSGTDFQIDSGAVGTTEAAALDAADITTGTFTDAQVSGSNEADEVNPTLGTQTQGNYALGDSEGGAATTGDSATAFFSAGTIEDARIDGSAEVDEITLAGDVDGVGNSNDIDEANVETELEGVMDEADLQVGDEGSDPARGSDKCVFSTDATTAGNIVCEGDTSDTFESRMDFGDPSADRVFTLPNANSWPVTDRDYGDITFSASGQTVVIDADTVALTTDTTGNYAAGDAEAGAALTGDSATSFFSAGTIEDARISGSAEADEIITGDLGEITCSGGASCTHDADTVALTTDTTGNYAAGDAEAGAALTGDSATSFFSAGTIEDARIDGSAEADEVLNSDKGDFTCTTGSCSIDSWPTFNRQVVTATNTYTPTAGAISFFVRCQAAGGGGGGSDVTTGENAPGTGGGGGQYAELHYTSAEMGANAAVTIGSIGAASSGDGGNGGDAGDTLFNPAGSGGTLTVDGGLGGQGTGASNGSDYTEYVSGAGGSAASGGDFEVDGGAGGLARSFDTSDTGKSTPVSGEGGNAVLGHGGRSRVSAVDGSYNDQAGEAGYSYGGGGSGGLDDDTTGSAGGAGGPAICIIDELLEG
jgi:hypothetical protein